MKFFGWTTIPKDRQARIEQLLDDFKSKLAAGESISVEEITTQYPDLMPELRQRLEDLLFVYRAKQAADETQADADQETLPMAGSTATAPGSVVRYFGDYELLEEIGRGGMGVVYKARQVSLDRLVAVKMILSGQLATQDDIARFYTEAQSAANLQHPNIVSVHEVGEHEGQHYFAMDYVHGQSLSKLIRENPLSARRAADFVVTIAQAIHYAHQRGVLHRDLKPSNILVDSSDQPHVTDFGLAKRLDSQQTVTASGDVMGTPSYMAPEQAASNRGQIGVATDIYGVGAILYELLTGRPPFKSETPLQTMQQVLENDPAAPRSLNAAVTKDLETICMKCLEKAPPKRYHSAQAVADEVERFLDGKPIQARPVGRPERTWRWCRRNPVVAGLSATAALLLIAVAVSTSIGYVRINAALAESERNLYFNRIALAHREWDAGNVGHTEELLEQCRPNLRSWEWRYVKRLCHLDLMTLKGHSGDVSSVAFSPEGDQIASGSTDNTIKLWDAATGQEVLTLKGHSHEVYDVAFSPGGRRIASGSRDHTTKLWDAATGQEVLTLKGHSNIVGSVAFSPDGGRIASGGRDNTIKVWDAVTGQEILTLNGHSNAVYDVAFSPRGRRIASGSFDHTIKVWDAATGQEVLTLWGHSGAVNGVVFSPDGGRIASGSRDNTIKVWDAATGQEVLTLKGHSNWVDSIGYSPDGGRITSGSWDSTIKLWDAATSQVAMTLKGHSGGVSSVAFRPDGGRIASGSYDHTIKVWEAATSQEVLTLKGHSHVVSSIAFSPDGGRIVSGSGDNTIKLWDAADGKEVLTLKGHLGAVLSVSFSPDGDRIASGSYDHTIKVWEAATGQEVLTLKGHSGTVYDVSFSPDGGRIASGSEDKMIKVWDAATGQEVLTLKGHSNNVFSVAFSPEGGRIASGSFDNTIKVWDSTWPPEPQGTQPALTN
jgi:WD40 repeat protein/predicted Ser/Thr protein kinase